MSLSLEEHPVSTFTVFLSGGFGAFFATFPLCRKDILLNYRKFRSHATKAATELVCSRSPRGSVAGAECICMAHLLEKRLQWLWPHMGMGPKPKKLRFFFFPPLEGRVALLGIYLVLRGTICGTRNRTQDGLVALFFKLFIFFDHQQQFCKFDFWSLTSDKLLKLPLLLGPER